MEIHRQANANRSVAPLVNDGSGFAQFTASQFDQPIAYTDVLTDRADAEQGATSDQLAQLRAAFLQHQAR